MATNQNVPDLYAKPFSLKKYDSYLLAKGMRYKGNWL